jgi:transcriptional antiterminator
MNQNSKENKNQPDENIDKVIDSAVENAEVRKELSEAELEEINGGVITAGSFFICTKDWDFVINVEINLAMNQNSKKEDKNQSHDNIDEIIDSAIDNAETRKELSEAELEEVAGGINFFGTVGFYQK